MKKLLSVLMLVTFGANANAFVPYPNITPSLVSAMSVASIIAIPLSPFVSVYLILDEAFKAKKPLKITKVKKEETHTVIEGVGINNEPVAFKINSKIAEDAKLDVNTNVNVMKSNMGYVLEANTVGLGVVSENTNNFKSEQISK